jgi:hypothetical protein
LKILKLRNIGRKPQEPHAWFAFLMAVKMEDDQVKGAMIILLF